MQFPVSNYFIVLAFKDVSKLEKYFSFSPRANDEG